MRLTTKNLNRCTVRGRKPLVSTYSHCFRPCADYKSKDEKCQENFDNERDERNFYYSAWSSKNISRVLHKLRGGNGNAGFAFSRHGFRSGNTRVDSPNRNGRGSFVGNCQRASARLHRIAASNDSANKITMLLRKHLQTKR